MAKVQGTGAVLLAVWLILHGLFELVGLRFDYQAEIMGILALVTGVLVLVGK